MSGVLAAFLFALGVALMLFYFAPGPLTDAFASYPERRRSMQENLSRSLRLAGLFSQTPTVVIVALTAVIITTGLVITVVLGSFFGFLIALVLVPAVAHYMLMVRQRDYMNRAADELGPFLNRIATTTKAGRPVQSAYVEAVEESSELKRVLAESAAQMTAGRRFRDALIDTIPLLPFRMWSIFVRQLEAHDEGGGDITSAIEETVTQTNEVLMLHAEARATYAAQARQQKLIAVIAIGGVAFFILTNGVQTMQVLWTTVAGYFVLALAFAIMGFGFWFSRKQLTDIEKKQAF
jgi:Flp pilus assembly protein TadB